MSILIMTSCNTNNQKLTSLAETVYSRWTKTITEQSEGHTGNATATVQKASTIPYRYGQLFIKVFCPIIRTCQAYLCKLSKEKVPFNWGPGHDEAFHLIKKEITAAPILAYYNPNKPMILQMDASSKGLGACLLQNEKPVYFASKALTEMQKGYIAIEPRVISGCMGNGKVPPFLIWK